MVWASTQNNFDAHAHAPADLMSLSSCLYSDWNRAIIALDNMTDYPILTSYVFLD